MALIDTLWSEREFLVSLGILLVSTATLVAVGYLNYQALQYKKRKEEPPNFELEEAYSYRDGYHISARLRNVGPGDCDTLEVYGHAFTAGAENVSFSAPTPLTYNHIPAGEAQIVQLYQPEGFDQFNLEESSFIIYYRADGARGRVYINPGDYVEDSFFFQDFQ